LTEVVIVVAPVYTAVAAEVVSGDDVTSFDSDVVNPSHNIVVVVVVVVSSQLLAVDSAVDVGVIPSDVVVT
jgi:hypothetical protein